MIGERHAEQKPAPEIHSASGTKLTHAEFFHQAIRSLRKPPYKGIHSVYYGFNEAFRAYFDDDPVAWTKQLAAEGVIEVHPSRNGVMLYIPGEAPIRRTGKDILKKMGINV